MKYAVLVGSGWFWAMLALVAFGVDPPVLIPYQGHLASPVPGDPGRFEPVPDGEYDFIFTLYATPVGGEAKVWGPERHVGISVVNGLVTANLGSVIGFRGELEANPDFFGRPLYVGVTIDADRNPNSADLELIPRQVLLPAVYALRAGDVDKLGGLTADRYSTDAELDMAFDDAIDQIPTADQLIRSFVFENGQSVAA